MVLNLVSPLNKSAILFSVVLFLVTGYVTFANNPISNDSLKSSFNQHSVYFNKKNL